MAVVGALAATVALALRVRTQPRVVRLVSTAALCIALSLTVFFLFTWPANQATQNWTALPEDWEALRRQWEYSHAAGALLYFIALAALSLAALGFKGSENLK